MLITIDNCYNWQEKYAQSLQPSLSHFMLINMQLYFWLYVTNNWTKFHYYIGYKQIAVVYIILFLLLLFCIVSLNQRESNSVVMWAFEPSQSAFQSLILIGLFSHIDPRNSWTVRRKCLRLFAVWHTCTCTCEQQEADKFILKKLYSWTDKVMWKIGCTRESMWADLY